MEREAMEYDVVIVGAGPAGLAAACRIRQLSEEAGTDISVCVVEKGSEVGAHILSGAVFEPTALNELFPNWKELGAPLNTPVKHDDIYMMTSGTGAVRIPDLFVPRTMHNHGNYIVSMGNVCRWLAEQAEGLGVEIFPGFAAAEVVYNDDGSVKGIATGDMGVAADGSEKGGYEPGMELHGKYTIFSEGCRGMLGKQLINKFNLDEGRDPQHYGIGIKEVWKIPSDKHEPGLVVHSMGWPLDESSSTGGGFLYHADNDEVYLGLITDLSYTNPHVSPFDEMQRLKNHPKFKQYLEGGERLTYGARALVKGGPQALPKLSVPGGLLVGDNAGTMNGAKIKGNHTAMKSGMVAAEAIVKALGEGKANTDLTDYEVDFKNSWAYKEIHEQRNFSPAIHKFGLLIGAAYGYIDVNIFRGKLPWTLHDTKPDHATLKPAASCKKIDYPKPDNKITFDKLSSVFSSNTNHEEDQPCHLQLADPSIPMKSNYPTFDEPAQRFCPAGVYEIVENEGEKTFQINAQNCVHCKTCDIKDPAQNITWVCPEGAGGPNYPNM